MKIKLESSVGKLGPTQYSSYFKVSSDSTDEFIWKTVISTKEPGEIK